MKNNLHLLRSLHNRALAFYHPYLERIAHLHLSPLAWDAGARRCEPVTGWSLGIVYTGVLGVVLYTAYLWMSFVLLRKGKLSNLDHVPTSAAEAKKASGENLAHFAFAIFYSMGAVLSVRAAVYAEETAASFNQLFRFMTDLKRKYSVAGASLVMDNEANMTAAVTKAKEKAKIHIGVTLLIAYDSSIRFTQPLVFLVYFFSSVRSKRYLLWLMLPPTAEFSADSWFSWSVLVGYSIIYFWQNMTVIHIIDFHLMWIFCHLYNTLAWLRSINTKAISRLVSLRRDPEKTAFLIYRRLQVMNKISMTGLRPLFPLLIFFNYAFGITMNFVVLLRNGQYPLPIMALAYFSSFFCWGLLLTVYPTMANIQMASAQFSKSWKNYTMTKNTEPPITVGHWDKVRCQHSFAVIKSFRPITIPVGNFFVIQRTSSYKFVLFMVYQTMRSILLFGKK